MDPNITWKVGEYESMMLTRSTIEDNSQLCALDVLGLEDKPSLSLSWPFSQSSQVDELPPPISIQHHVPDVFYAVQVCASLDDIDEVCCLSSSASIAGEIKRRLV